MNITAVGSARALLAALLVLIPGGALRAQGSGAPARVRSPGFGGGGFFISPHTTFDFARFRARGELELAWGESSTRDGSASLTVQLPGDLRLSGLVNGLSADDGREHRSDHMLGAAIERGRAAFSIARRSSDAATEDYTSEVTGLDVRLGVALGTPLDINLGLSRSSSTVVQRGDLEEIRRLVVAGYEFISIHRLEYLEAARHQDVELELSAAAGPVRLSSFLGRGFSDGGAPDRTWAYGRVAIPVAQRFEVLLEGGRNAGVPAIGRVPNNFARIGLRMDLGGGETPRRQLSHPYETEATASIEFAGDGPRLIIAATAASTIDVKGDFTEWEPVAMQRLPDGRWFIPVREGMLQFNIRVDGRSWSVPAGVPVVADEFSGAPVAILVVNAP